MNKKVGKQIKRLRSSAGLSQHDLSKTIGMSPGNYGKIERGEIDVNSATLMAIANALKVTPGDFFGAKPKTTNEKGLSEAIKLLRTAIKKIDKLQIAVSSKK